MRAGLCACACRSALYAAEGSIFVVHSTPLKYSTNSTSKMCILVQGSGLTQADAREAKGYLHWTGDFMPPPSISQRIGYSTLGLRLHGII